MFREDWDYKKSIVQILIDGKSNGTGFVVTKNIVVTCAHIIGKNAEKQRKPQIEVLFWADKTISRADLIHKYWRSPAAEDIAVLCINAASDQAIAARLGSSEGRSGQRCKSFGYPVVGSYDGLGGDALVVVHVEKKSGLRLLQISSSQITTGFSGAPLFDTESNRVIGMVTEFAEPDQHGKLRDTAFVTPSEILKAVIPEIEFDEYKKGSNRVAIETTRSYAPVPKPSNPLLVGRDEYINELDEIWNTGGLVENGQFRDVRIVQFVADGGMGKSALVWRWLQELKKTSGKDSFHILEWSFFSQGTNDDVNDSRAFMDECVRHFRSRAMIFSPTEKFNLSELVADPELRRNESLVGSAVGDVLMGYDGVTVLDGAEPLQQLTAGVIGELKDQGLRGFFNSLIQSDSKERKTRWLVIVTTRVPITLLDDVDSAKTYELKYLDEDEGLEFLRNIRLKNKELRLHYNTIGPDEAAAAPHFRQITVDCKGHPFSLLLLASQILYRFAGDISKRDGYEQQLFLEDQPSPVAERLIASYERFFQQGSSIEKASRQLLCVIGMFTRPVRIELIDELRTKPVIRNLSGLITKDSLFEQSLSLLQQIWLINVHEEPNGKLLDTHPIVREYFGQSVLRKKYPTAWRQAHHRVFHFLRQRTVETPSTWFELEPVLQAVGHGCKAGLQRESLEDVLVPRVMRNDECYAFTELGATGPLLSALAHFFDGDQWSNPSPNLDRNNQLTVLGYCALCLMTTHGYSHNDVRSVCLAMMELANRRDAVSTPQLFAAMLWTWAFHLVRAELRNARKLATQLLATAEQLNSETRILESKFSLGITLLMCNELQDARNYLLDASIRYGKTEHQWMTFLNVQDLGVATNSFLGRTYFYLGYDDEAIQHSSSALQLAESLGGLPYNIVFGQTYLGWMHLNLCNYDQARKLLEPAKSIATQKGYLLWQSVSSVLLSQIMALNGHDTRQSADEAIRLYRGIGGRLGLPHFLLVSAKTHSILGDQSGAMKRIVEAEAVASDPLFPQSLDTILIKMTKGALVSRWQQENGETADECFRAALRFAVQNKIVRWQDRIREQAAEYEILL